MSKRSVYKRKIIKHFYFGRSYSSTELSLLLNKSIPFTTGVLGEMVEDGVIEEIGYADSRGGRRPQMYGLKADLLNIVAVSIDQINTNIAMFDLHNEMVHPKKNIEFKLSNTDYNDLVQITNHIENYIENTGIDPDKILGIGISMPGFVDVNKGVNHTFLKSAHGSIVDYIEDRIGLPVLIDNDSSLIALSELRFGAARDKMNVMVLNLSWGVGLGMILKGEIFRGSNGYAGEFSHIPLFDNNKLCQCGKSGCLETETSLLVLVQKAIEQIEEGKLSLIKDISESDLETAVNKIMNAAKRGDRVAINLLSDIGYTIGRGVAILIHLLNPEMIILSGRGAEAGRLWVAPIQQALNEHCIPKISEGIKLEISNLGYEAGLIGAAALVMEKYDSLSKFEKRIKVVQK
ncbi:ROK family protein [Membranihabitans maritimus]|uniref:ROK family protein n=1 Tax=Membranihabitans maritimus TaxID=2904244 RepID=UPI001F40F0CA|nr:ROK family protein [Membranihabitans maritimus]